MIGTADNDDGIGRRQIAKRLMRIGRLRMVDDDDTDVFAWDLGNRPPIALQKYLLVLQSKVRRLLRDFNRMFNHDVPRSKTGKPTIFVTRLVDKSCESRPEILVRGPTYSTHQVNSYLPSLQRVYSTGDLFEVFSCIRMLTKNHSISRRFGVPEHG